MAKKKKNQPRKIGDVFTRRASRSIGNDFLSTFSKNVAASPRQAIEELVANAYDEDATEVHVEYKPGESLTVRDNGGGMSPSDFDHFLRSSQALSLLV